MLTRRWSTCHITCDWWEHRKLASTLENSLAISWKLNKCSTIWPSNPTPVCSNIKLTHQTCYAKLKELDSKGNMLSGSIHMIFWKRSNNSTGIGSWPPEAMDKEGLISKDYRAVLFWRAIKLFSILSGYMTIHTCQISENSSLES